MFQKALSWFAGPDSRKRYLFVGYLVAKASHAVLLQQGILHFDWPHSIEKFEMPFAVWAGADALKKLER